MYTCRCIYVCMGEQTETLPRFAAESTPHPSPQPPSLYI